MRLGRSCSRASRRCCRTERPAPQRRRGEKRQRPCERAAGAPRAAQRAPGRANARVGLASRANGDTSSGDSGAASAEASLDRAGRQSSRTALTRNPERGHSLARANRDYRCPRDGTKGLSKATDSSGSSLLPARPPFQVISASLRGYRQLPPDLSKEKEKLEPKQHSPCRAA